MKKVHLRVLMFFCFPVIAAAQTQHFSFTANTGDSYSIVVTSTTLDGIDLSMDDEIGVFTPDDLCVGASVWTGTSPLALTAWVDDSQTSEVDGYAAGDSMFFRIWQQSNDEEFDGDPAYASGNGTFGNGAFASVALVATSGVQPVGIMVTNTNDSGEGSLREALVAAGSHPGPDTVAFNIPTNDPGYDPSTGVWTIKPAIGYDVLPGTTVDGTITNTPPGEGNTSKPGIEIDGTTLAQLGYTGLRLLDDVILRGLIVNHFQYGIWVDRANATVENCYVGTDATGTIAKPNGINGILLANGATGAVIQDNLLSGNNASGIRMAGDATTGNSVLNNRIGTDAAGTALLPNGRDGIRLHAGAHDNILEGNLISGNSAAGIHIMDAGTNSNVLRSNRIGTDAGGTEALPNGSYGVAFFNGPQNNVVGPDNLVSHNNFDGVLVDGADSFTSTVGNTITANSITANGSKGIYTFRGGNTELTPPIIDSMTAGEVTGTAGAGQIVEIFTDENDEGLLYLGSTTTDASGHFQWSGTPTGPFVTATATDTAGNTSQFSQPKDITSVAEAAEVTIPEAFSLSQNFPNPFNPATKIQFALPSRSKVTLKIYNLLGEALLTLIDEEMSAGVHNLIFNGAQLSSGVYFYRLQASNPQNVNSFTQTRKLTLLK